MKTLTGKYKCGHTWAVMYQKTPSKREITLESAHNNAEICRKCQEIKQNNYTEVKAI